MVSWEIFNPFNHQIIKGMESRMICNNCHKHMAFHGRIKSVRIFECPICEKITAIDDKGQRFDTRGRVNQ